MLDIYGRQPDFILNPIGDEVSSRELIRPFRPDLVEKLHIKKGDYVIGRPMGVGCPITHVLEVVSADKLTGVLTVWVVGQKYSRNNNPIDIKVYDMVGFEGIISDAVNPIEFGKRYKFMPCNCMMRLNHSGFINTLAKTRQGLMARIEGILILE